MPERVRPSEPLISVVVPVLNEEDCVDELAARIRKALGGSGLSYELLFIDDGSWDTTPDRIEALRKKDGAIAMVRFTRAFGHQAALAAGLQFARGDAVITMDGDLQHPPELLPEMVAAWREGADVVHMVRRDTTGAQPYAKALTSRIFYRLMRKLSGVPVVTGGADFRLLDRRAVDAFRSLEEHFVFLRGLVPWLGFPEASIKYDVGERRAGEPKYKLRRMIRLALDGIFSFSVVPLRLIAAFGLMTTATGLLYGAIALAAWATGEAISGWTSLVVLLLIFGGAQLLSLGVVSEYVGRTYEEVKRRPRYVIDRVEGIEWP